MFRAGFEENQRVFISRFINSKKTIRAVAFRDRPLIKNTIIGWVLSRYKISSIFLYNTKIFGIMLAKRNQIVYNEGVGRILLNEVFEYGKNSKRIYKG